MGRQGDLSRPGLSPRPGLARTASRPHSEHILHLKDASRDENHLEYLPDRRGDPASYSAGQNTIAKSSPAHAAIDSASSPLHEYASLHDASK